MTKRTLKVAAIGNSRGVRLPADTLERYRIGASVTMEELPEGILLRPAGDAPQQLSWDETAAAMAAAAEDWSAWEATSSDGFEYAPWAEAPGKVSERRGAYAEKKRGAAASKRRKK